MKADDPENLGNIHNTGPEGIVPRFHKIEPDEEPEIRRIRLPGFKGKEEIFNKPLRNRDRLSPLLNIHEREEERIDGSHFVREAFGGFGPGSPEYDDNRRLQIVIPDPKRAVSWFRQAQVGERSSLARETFTTSIHETSHPGVRNIEVKFLKSQETSLISGEVSTHIGAYSPPHAPEKHESGKKFEFWQPYRKMIAEHMQTYLQAKYGDRFKQAGKSGNMAVEVEDGITLYFKPTGGDGLEFAVNGAPHTFMLDKLQRFGSSTVSATQLEKELVALKEHLPTIVETYADFWRQQLPPTELRIDYQGSENEAQLGDPTDPQRLERLRQELVVTPREDDFKYIGGLGSHIEKMRKAALAFAHPEAFKEFGVDAPRGMILMGKPGTGKTSLAMAFARESDSVVLDVRPSKIKNAFHGETERNIRGVFALTDQLIAEGERVVILIDEIETLAPRRDRFSSSSIDNNVTSELLQGLNVDRPNCVVIAATNAPDMVDPALLNNQSRFPIQLEVGLPDTAGRADIIHKLMRKFADKSTSGSTEALFGGIHDLLQLAEEADGATGADIEAAMGKVLRDKASHFAETGEKPGPVTYSEIHRALNGVIAGHERSQRNYL